MYGEVHLLQMVLTVQDSFRRFMLISDIQSQDVPMIRYMTEPVLVYRNLNRVICSSMVMTV